MTLRTEPLDVIRDKTEAHAINMQRAIIERVGFTLWPMLALDCKYYIMLPAYMDLYGIKSVLEYGTCSGASALAMSLVAERVVTVDITDQFQWHDRSVFEEANIEFIVKPDPEAVLAMPACDYEMIFVDAGHNGHEEEAFHKRFVKEHKGLVFWDDIHINEGMQKFWDSITQEKVETLWHGQMGFGIVRYNE